MDWLEKVWRINHAQTSPRKRKAVGQKLRLIHHDLIFSLGKHKEECFTRSAILRKIKSQISPHQTPLYHTCLEAEDSLYFRSKALFRERWMHARSPRQALLTLLEVSAPAEAHSAIMSERWPRQKGDSLCPSACLLSSAVLPRMRRPHGTSSRDPRATTLSFNRPRKACGKQCCRQQQYHK